MWVDSVSSTLPETVIIPKNPGRQLAIGCIPLASAQPQAPSRIHPSHQVTPFGSYFESLSMMVQDSTSGASQPQGKSQRNRRRFTSLKRNSQSFRVSLARRETNNNTCSATTGPTVKTIKSSSPVPVSFKRSGA